MNRLCRCGAETSDFLCSACLRDLTANLAAIPAWLRDLDITVSRQDNLGGAGTALAITRRTDIPDEDITIRRNTAGQLIAERHEPLPAHLRTRDGHVTLPVTRWPYAPDAADLADTARNTLTTWARHLAETRGVDVHLGPPIGPLCRVETDVDDFDRRELGITPQHLPCTHRSCRAIAKGPGISQDQWIVMWLLRVADSIRFDEAAAQIYDEIEWLTGALERARDRREPDLYAGRCDADDVRVDIDIDSHEEELLMPHLAVCGADLYGRLEDAKVTCRQCGMVYDAKARHEQLQAASVDVWATARQIADALSSWDMQVTRETINLWAYRARARRADRKPPKDGDFYRVDTIQCAEHLGSIGDVECSNCKPLYRLGDVADRVEIAKDVAKLRQAEQAVNRAARKRVSE